MTDFDEHYQHFDNPIEFPISQLFKGELDLELLNAYQRHYGLKVEVKNITTFDQRGQHVTYQYNAAGNINFGSVQNRMELISELEKVKNEFSKAANAQVIDAQVVTYAEYELAKAIQQAQKPEPNKKAIMNHIETAKALIEGVATASGLVTALVQAAELVERLF